MGKYRIEIKRSALKEINKLPSKDLKKILTKIKSLALNPRPAGCQKLSAQERCRLRYGVYRILYEIQDDVLVVYIVKVGHRKEIYK